MWNSRPWRLTMRNASPSRLPPVLLMNIPLRGPLMISTYLWPSTFCVRSPFGASLEDDDEPDAAVLVSLAALSLTAAACATANDVPVVRAAARATVVVSGARAFEVAATEWVMSAERWWSRRNGRSRRPG